MQESFGECACGSGGCACGTAGWDGEIVRRKIYNFGDTFGMGPQNVDRVKTVVVRGGYKIPTVDTVGSPGAMIARFFVSNNVGIVYFRQIGRAV